MASLRQLANCIGLPQGRLSVIHDFFGYIKSPVDNSEIIFIGNEPLSVLKQVRLLKGTHIHLNLIFVGRDKLSSAQDEFKDISYALRYARHIFASVNLGIGRVIYSEITSDQSDGFEIINDECEAEDLTDEWSAPHEGIDVFLVLSMYNYGGLSAVDGPCAKYDPVTMSGSVIQIGSTSPGDIGVILAHEVGHYLGLSHYIEMDEWGNLSPVQLNLMNPNAMSPNRQLLAWQGDILRSENDCHLHGGC